MSGAENDCDCPSCQPPMQGDFVLVIQTGWVGQVINSRQEGFNDREYQLRIFHNGILFREWFTECEIDTIPDAEEDGGDEAEGDTNVVRVDFTKAAKLRADTKTEGAA